MPGEMEGGAQCVVENRQAVLPVSGELLDRLAGAGRGALVRIAERGLALGGIPAEVFGYLVDDRTISELHGQYMGDPTPTDVITFPYGESGEIFISVETARRQAAEYGAEWEGELALYLVHGILHLCGYEDLEEDERRSMESVQKILHEEVCRRGDGVK